MSGSGGSLFTPDEEQGKLVEEEVPVRRVLGILRLNVPVGQQLRLFKNKTFVENLGPGGYTRVDFSPFARYSIQRVDAKVRTTGKILAKGAIPGEPGMPPCRITLPMQLTYQLQDINTLLMTVKPLDRLTLITKDQAATQISQLRYGEYTQWATTLREELQRWLQIHAVERTGLQVLEVLISEEPTGENEADRLMLKKYATIRTIEIEDLRAEADRRNKVRDFQAIAQAAGAVGLDPTEMAAAEKAPAILEYHAQQEERRINALGIAGPRPLIREETPPAGELPAAGGSSAASAGPGGRLTAEFPSDASNPSAPSPEPPPNPAGATIDMDRVNMEIAQLEKKGYRVQHVAAQVNNVQGGVSRGYRVTVFPGDVPSVPFNYVQFELDPQFPQTAPIVTVSRPGAAPARWTGYILDNWKNFTRLEEVLEAILRAG